MKLQSFCVMVVLKKKKIYELSNPVGAFTVFHILFFFLALSNSQEKKNLDINQLYHKTKINMWGESVMWIMIGKVIINHLGGY